MTQRTAAEIALERAYYMIDIRPPEERLGELGFVPGSLTLDSHELGEVVDDDDLPIVLYCTSGRRSGEYIANLPDALAERAINLEGGLLAWINADLAVATGDNVELANAGSDGAHMFLTGLRSCFIGQLVETILEFDLDLDPLELFEQLEAKVRTRRHADSGAYLRDLIDHSAHLSRFLGTPLDAIASNTMWAYGNVARFEDEFPPLAELDVSGT